MKTLELGDAIFYAIIGLVLILLFWLRFLETSVGLWGAWLVWAVWTCFLTRSYFKARRRTKI